MKNLIWLIIILVVFFYLAKTSLQFKPFKVSFESLPYAIGFVFLLIAFVLFQYQSFSDGENKGYKKRISDLEELVKKQENDLHP